MHKFICNLKMYVCVFVYKMFIYIQYEWYKKFYTEGASDTLLQGSVIIKTIIKMECVSIYTRSDK